MTLQLSLRVDGERLVSSWTNTGEAPIALAFWWNRRLVVRDAQGLVVKPGPGPVLPCGVQEDWTVIEPGATFERDEALGCTQPAGRTEDIGWSYELPPGTFSIRLQFAAPSAHGFSQSALDSRAWTGSLESNDVGWTVAPKKGWVDRLLGR